MSFPYTIKSGDTLSAIAKRNGFASWQEIYFHPDNAAFRKKRPNPDRIFPGDVLMIPDDSPVDSTPPPPNPPVFVRRVPPDPRNWGATTNRGSDGDILF